MAGGGSPLGGGGGERKGVCRPGSALRLGGGDVEHGGEQAQDGVDRAGAVAGGGAQDPGAGAGPVHDELPVRSDELPLEVLVEPPQRQRAAVLTLMGLPCASVIVNSPATRYGPLSRTLMLIVIYSP